MSKLKKQLRAYFDENLSHNDQYEKIATKANLQSTKKESKFYMSKKLLLRIALPCFLGLALIITVVAVSLSRGVSEQPGDTNPAAVIQMDVNPSLSLVVDDNNVVLSVYGENDEGKMILCDIDLVGLSIDVAIEKIITEEVNTGYLLKGNAKAEENEISFVIEADTQAISTALEAKINDVTKDVCKELKVNNVVNIEQVVENTKSSLIERAKELDPTITEEELNEKSNQELIKFIAGCQLEKAEIPTEELVALYDKVKTSQVNLSEHEYVVNTINAIDGEVYQEFKNGYALLITKLKEANTALETAYYDNFIKSESEYQKALAQFLAAKQETIKFRVDVAEMEEGPLKEIKKLELQAKETALTIAVDAFEKVADITKGIIDQLQLVLDNIIIEMENYQKELPEEIKTVLTEKVEEVDQVVNKAKDDSFAYFEENFKDEIELAVAKLKEQKQAMVDQLK